MVEGCSAVVAFAIASTHSLTILTRWVLTVLVLRLAPHWVPLLLREVRLD